MKPPIEIQCPACESPAGKSCSVSIGPNLSKNLTCHHSERVDDAFRQASQPPNTREAKTTHTMRFLGGLTQVGCSCGWVMVRGSRGDSDDAFALHLASVQ